MSTLSDFISGVREGLSRTNHFSVLLTPPSSLANDNIISPKMTKILLFCEQAQLPGVSFSTSQVRSFGEFKEVPYEKLYEPITLNFFADSNLTVKVLFDKWVNLIQDTSTRMYSYPDEYMTDNIKIFVHDVQNQKKYCVTLYECYPKAVAPIQLDYNNKEIMRVQVQIVYKYFTTEQITNGQTNTSVIAQNEPRSLMDYGYKAAESIIPATYFSAFDSFQGVVNNYERMVSSALEDLNAFTGWGISL